MTASIELKEKLTHTWPVFFAHHGNFTEIQRQAMPGILAGHNTLLIAATAAGKTEAAVAPLLERHILAADRATRTHSGLRILYICPTRALTRDLYERLRTQLETLNVAFAMKSGDTAAVSVTNPPTLLMTTPESTDSLLTRAPRLLGSLDAIVLDEIHLFDNTPRGDHLRCLLRRIEHIRTYRQQELGMAEPVPLQRIALSATVPDPAGVAQRYLTPELTARQAVPTHAYQIVQVAGARRIEAELVPMHGLADLVTALSLRAAGYFAERLLSASRKSLVFCNTRNEVEQVAAYLRKHLPFDAAVFVHYSNLDAAMRLQVETDFAEAPVALCVCTTTLELGIDIGSIDDVVLVGPPPTMNSFLQRIGRGGRRSGATRVLCLPRTALEDIRFRALLDIAQSATLPTQDRVASDLTQRRSRRSGGAEVSTAYQVTQVASNPITTEHPDSPFRTLHSALRNFFRPSVLVQQTFSILKQSPTGALRLADLRRVAPTGMTDETLRSILNNLVSEEYLQTGRPGEWRPGPALDELLDKHEIYSNIGADPLAALIVDAYSGRIIAQMDKMKTEGETLLLGGQTLEVVWRDRYRLGVQRAKDDPGAEELRVQAAPFAVPLEVGQAVAAYLGLQRGELCVLHDANGAWLFHFWGDIYGALLAALLQLHFAGDVAVTMVLERNEFCLHMPTSLTHLPAWDGVRAVQQLRRLLPRIEPFLELGRFHALLPAGLAHQTALTLCDLPRFEQLYRSATLVTPSVGLRAQLESLLS